MVPTTKERQLTELQIKFLDALFGEAMGDANKAKQLAGYDSTTSTSGIVKSVQQEILEHSKLYLATHTPRALLEMMTMLVNPNEPGASTKLKVIQEILNRAGVVDHSSSQGPSVNVNAKIILMPAKETPVTIDLDRSQFSEIQNIIDETEM
jgi:hypothetical protein